MEHIPPVSAAISNSQGLTGTLLLNTMDFRGALSFPPLYPSGLQIIDPMRPYPPLFFTTAEPGGLGFVGNGMYMDFRLQYPNGELSFYKAIRSDSGAVSGKYFICDTLFAVLDSFSGAHQNIDAHDFQINSTGEKLYMSNYDSVMDITALSGVPADSAVLLSFQKIEITDENDSLIFLWNPFDYIPLTDTYKDPANRDPGDFLYLGLDWSHGNSVRFASDGDILYSYRHLGVGKIDRETGRLLWKLGGRTPTIAVPSGGDYQLQHDFHEIAPGYYALFSNGDDTYSSKAIIYHIDEQNLLAEIHNIHQPSQPIFSSGLGNYDFGDNGMRLVNYGSAVSGQNSQKIFEIIDSSGIVQAEYASPSLVYAYRGQRVSWKPQQPAVSNNSGTLSAAGPGSETSWYKISGNSAAPVAQGLNFFPAIEGDYVAVQKMGFGWLVSEPYHFVPDTFHTSTRGDTLIPKPFFTTEGDKILSHNYSGEYSVLNLSGQRLWKGKGACLLSNIGTQLLLVQTGSGWVQKIFYCQ